MLRKLLDQMIAHGDIDPMIVVTPTYNYGQPTANYTDADPYCRALPQELVNDLIPVVESRYRTYAETTDAEGIEASREHRAIGGFSMGAVTTWYAFDETLDAFKWFMPISGDCWSLGRFAGMNRPAMKRRLIWQTRYGNPHTPERVSIFGRRAEQVIRRIVKPCCKLRGWHACRKCSIRTI